MAMDHLLACESPGRRPFDRLFRLDLGDGRSACVSIAVIDRHAPRDADRIPIARPPSTAEILQALGQLSQLSCAGI